jgi:cell growth-regulating nucleolar protein
MQPWFYCDDCGDSIKKPKITQHCHQCSASKFTCIDCSATFDRHTVQARCKGLCRNHAILRFSQLSCGPPSFLHLKGWCAPRAAMQSHTQCVTEHEKYALGATKPGGYAASGFAANGTAKPGQDGEPGG